MVWVLIISSLFASGYTGKRHEFVYGEFTARAECDAAARRYMKSDHYKMYNKTGMDMKVECRRERRP